MMNIHTRAVNQTKGTLLENAEHILLEPQKPKFGGRYRIFMTTPYKDSGWSQTRNSADADLFLR